MRGIHPDGAGVGDQVRLTVESVVGGGSFEWGVADGFGKRHLTIW